jgi:hypothetical protein
VPRTPSLLRSLLPLALALHLLAGSAAAQQLVVAELRGQVLLDETPLAGARVVLHHVGALESGPVDSLLTARDGGFRFPLPNVPDPATDPEIWFASVFHGGVNYFSEPIQLAIQLDSAVIIRVFDSETAPPGGAALSVTARYTLIEQEGGQWFLTDLLHPRNATGRTLIAGPDGATWTYPLPEGASDLQLGGEQMAPSMAEIVDGNLRVSSPIQPGIQEIIVRYRVPEPFMTLSYPGVTDSVELMIREPAPVAVEGLANGEPVEMEPGVRYRRFAGTGLLNAVVSLTEAVQPPELPMRWMTVGVALLLTLAGVVAVLRPHASVVLPGQRVAATVFDAGMSPFERRQLLLLEVARLDEARARGEAPDDEWSNRRRTLLERARELGRTGS